MAECSLESVQIHALAGLYYESCSRHLEFWRMTISASMACHALISANPGELESPRLDLIRRVFWHCSIMETYLNLELEIPLTGLDKLEGKVGLPDFSGPFCEADYLGNQESRFQEHFASQIVLRQLSVGFHDTMRDATGPTAAPMPFPPPDRQTQPSEGSNPKSQLEQKDAEANEKLQRMIADQREAEQRKNTSLEIQAALEKQESEVASRKKIVLEDLARAEPAEASDAGLAMSASQERYGANALLNMGTVPRETHVPADMVSMTAASAGQWPTLLWNDNQSEH
ncbi:Dynein heavy chain like protein [Verticillium longisporum]|nr:Dynein heavy chain like protein [Verticillium longisporum]